MSALFLHYPKCTTCKKALSFLKNKEIEIEVRDIVLERPTKEELTEWVTKSGLPFKRFFNTSGVLYREMGLKDKIVDLSFEEAMALLATDGKLVKRPLLITEKSIIVGFKEDEYGALK